MTNRILGYCPDCGKPLRRLSSHGSAAVQLQFPEVTAYQAEKTGLFMEDFMEEKNSENFGELVVEASRQLIISKVKRKLSTMFDKKFDDLADEIIKDIIQGKKIENQGIWKRKTVGNEEALKVLNDLLAA